VGAVKGGELSMSFAIFSGRIEAMQDGTINIQLGN